MPRATRYRFVGGKGGVGKTTCAAAMALSAASQGWRTLVISTDPAGSLGDALAVPVESTPQPVRKRGAALHAAQVDANAFMRRWIRRHSPVLEQIALRGTWLDREDVVQLLRLSLPGVDEIAALLEIAGFERSGRYDLIVVDTAPTGHALRMLQTPQTLDGIASVFDAMQSKHRVMVEALRGSWRADPADAFIEGLVRDARELAALIADATRTEFVWVTLPEPMAIEESLDAIAALAVRRISIRTVVVNRVTPAARGSCAWCDARSTFERQAIAGLASRVLGRDPLAKEIAFVVAREREPIGATALAEIGAELAARRRPVDAGRRRRRVPLRKSRARVGRVPDVLEIDRSRLVLFGGKGGVGKTTCAAAAAIAAAWRARDRRILLISTDPAHSLADVLGVSCSGGSEPLAGGPPNLWVRELDASAAYAAMRERYASAVDALFDGLTRGSAFDAAHDRRVMHALLDLAPPGLDELVATMEIVGALAAGTAGGSFDTVVMDTAPTGHALRLLETPALVHEWVKALMRILLKYQPVVGVGGLGAVLLQVARDVGRLRAMLTDRRTTRFVVVARAALLPRAESARLLGRLKRMKVPVSGVIVNGVGGGSCARCRRIAENERRELAHLWRTVRTHAEAVRMIVAPNEAPPPHGAANLFRWAARWVEPETADRRTGKRQTAAISSDR